mgnify:CR=1 FL=1
MKHLIYLITRPFTRPFLRARLINGKTQVQVSMVNASREQAMLMLFSIIKEMAKTFGMDRRALMNKVIDLDKQIIKNHKAEEKAVRRQIYGNKK